MKLIIAVAMTFLIGSCRSEETQPKTIKIDETTYEIRYERGHNVSDIAGALCPDLFEIAELGERSDASGARVNVAIVKCK